MDEETKKLLSQENIANILEKLQKEKHPDCEHWEHAVSYRLIESSYFFRNNTVLDTCEKCGSLYYRHKNAKERKAEQKFREKLRRPFTI